MCFFSRPLTPLSGLSPGLLSCSRTENLGVDSEMKHTHFTSSVFKILPCKRGKITLGKTVPWLVRAVSSRWGLLEVEPGVKYPTDLLSALINHLPHVRNSSAIALCPRL